MQENNISLFGLDKQINFLKKPLIDSFEKCLEENLFISGKYCDQFSKTFAQFIGSGYGIGVASGLSALELALKAMGISKGDEVLVPHHTFVTTWLAVSNIGAIPIGVDVNEQGLINLDEVQSHINRKTKAIICVHLYGKMVDVKKLRSIVGSEIKIIEDAAQSHEAFLYDQNIGDYSNSVAFSFYPTKTIGCLGDGGFVYSLEQNHIERVYELANYGSKEKYSHEIQGTNSRLDEIQASFLIEKLKYVNEWVKKKKKNAKILYQACNKKGLEVCFQADDINYHAMHLFVIKTNQRSKLIKHLQNHNIDSGIHYPKIPIKQNAFKNIKASEDCYKVSKRLSETVLSIPCHQFLERNEIERVCNSILKF